MTATACCRLLQDIVPVRTDSIKNRTASCLRWRRIRSWPRKTLNSYRFTCFGFPSAHTSPVHSFLLGRLAGAAWPANRQHQSAFAANLGNTASPGTWQKLHSSAERQIPRGAKLQGLHILGWSGARLRSILHLTKGCCRPAMPCFARWHEIVGSPGCCFLAARRKNANTTESMNAPTPLKFLMLGRSLDRSFTVCRFPSCGSELGPRYVPME